MQAGDLGQKLLYGFIMVTKIIYFQSSPRTFPILYNAFAMNFLVAFWYTQLVDELQFTSGV